MNVIQKLVDNIAKKFMGTNIGHRFPLLISIYLGIKKLIYPADALSLVPVPNNNKLYVSPFSLVGAELVAKGTFEEQETVQFMKLVREGDIVVDIGANIGYYTVLGATLTKQKLLAIEPDPFNLPILRKNIELNNLANVTVAPYAVGSQQGTVSLSKEIDHAQTQINLTAGEIVIKTLPAILAEFGFTEVIDFLKIDTEGAEKMVLDGALQLFEKKLIKKLFIEINEKKLQTFGNTSEQVLDMLAKYFKLSLFEDNGNEITVKEVQELLKAQDYVNILGEVL